MFFSFVGYFSATCVCGEETNVDTQTSINGRITRNRDQQAIIWPNSLRKISGGDEEERGIYSGDATPHELKLQNSLIVNTDGLTYNVVRKQRGDLLRNSKEKSSSITFSSNLDSDEE